MADQADISVRLTEIRASLAVNQTSMGKLTGVGRDTWRRYEAGDMPSGEPLAKLADMGFSIDWILTGHGSMKLVEPALRVSPQPGLDDDYVLLPRYDVQASAGRGALVHSEQIVDYIAFKANWVRDQLGLDPDFLLLLKASGDSMVPTIADGDLLLVNRAIDAFKDSAIYTLAIDNDLIVKRVERRVTGDVVIKSDNPRYTPEILTAEEAANVRVIGQVVWHGGLV